MTLTNFKPLVVGAEYPCVLAKCQHREYCPAHLIGRPGKAKPKWWRGKFVLKFKAEFKDGFVSTVCTSYSEER